MYGFNQPNCVSANYYSLWNCGYDTEEIFVFPASEKKLYEVFIWFGQKLARQEQVRKEKAERCIQAYTVLRTPERVYKRVLFGAFA